MARFQGKSVLITGAAGGFGQLAAERFAAEGARLVLTDLYEDKLVSIADRLRNHGAEVVTLPGDVTDEGTAVRIVQISVDSFGGLDVAVNNAGVSHPLKKLTDTPVDILESMLRINVVGVFLAMRAQIPVMTNRGCGVILNLSSVAGTMGVPLLAAYAASKHAVIGLTKSVAAEVARHGVRVNALCPGPANTDMINVILRRKDGTQRSSDVFAQANPSGRLAEPKEVVDAMVWACSSESSYMNGHALVLDGGLSAI